MPKFLFRVAFSAEQFDNIHQQINSDLYARGGRVSYYGKPLLTELLGKTFPGATVDYYDHIGATYVSNSLTVTTSGGCPVSGITVGGAGDTSLSIQLDERNENTIYCDDLALISGSNAPYA